MARSIAIRAAVGEEAFGWLGAGAVFSSLNLLNARLWWKIAEEVIEAPLSRIQRVWVLPEVSISSDGTVYLPEEFCRILIGILEREGSDLLASIAEWGARTIARDLEQFSENSLAAIAARTHFSCLQILDTRQRGQGHQNLNLLKAEGYGKWIPEPLQEMLRLSRAFEDHEAIEELELRENESSQAWIPEPIQGIRPPEITEENERLEELFGKNFRLSGKWQQRRRIFEMLSDSNRPLQALDLTDRLRQRTRNGNDLFFLERAAVAIGVKHPKAAKRADKIRRHLYDHIPPPPKKAFQFAETKDGRVPLWRRIPGEAIEIERLQSEDGSAREPHPPIAATPSFQMTTIPITNRQYTIFDPYHSHADRYPAVNISWWAALAFCRWLATSLPGVRLPTEKEWEYAARAGTTTEYWSGDTENDLADVGWYHKNSGRLLHKAGEKPANPWGLYDVHGNIWEWTLSNRKLTGADLPKRRIRGTYASSMQTVIRGGSFRFEADSARVAYRDWQTPGVEIVDLGFRLVRSSAASKPRAK